MQSQAFKILKYYSNIINKYSIGLSTKHIHENLKKTYEIVFKTKGYHQRQNLIQQERHKAVNILPRKLAYYPTRHT